MLRAALLACSLLLAGALPGCGLFGSSEPIGFRSYVLKDVSYDEGVSVVRDTLRQYAVAHFGGVGITWDPPSGNLTLDPVYRGQRRMNFYIHLVRRDPDVDIEMFAVVEELVTEGGGQVGWLHPMQDVHLQEDFYQACVNELLARRALAP